VKRRWKLALGVGAMAFASILAPIAYIEIGCRSPLPGNADGPYVSLLPAAERRPEVRTWLTYPEWHIVYSADSLGRHLAAWRPPSSYPYGSDIAGFWSGFCAVNRVARGADGTGDAKLMIYTIGISYTVELALKAAYERTIGGLTEWVSGWTSADDRHAARTQQAYGAFMHEAPWYHFPFDEALVAEWQTEEPDLKFRHWERRFALSAEYAVKAGYAKLIDRASGATLGRDAPTLRFVARTTPETLQRIDKRLKPVRATPDGPTVVEAPRYAQFSKLLDKLSGTSVELVEIAGNDDILITIHLPETAELDWPNAETLLSMPLGERPGWRRVGLSVKVAELLPTIRQVKMIGGTVEHVYDY
jgi:hypothetical protein